MECKLCDYQNDNLKRFSDHVDQSLMFLDG